MKVNSEEAGILNIYLTTLRNKVLQHINILELQGIDITTESLSQAILGLDQENHSLIELFDYHNERMKSLWELTLPSELTTGITIKRQK